MSLSQVNPAYCLLSVAGVALIVFSTPLTHSLASRLRGWIWMTIILFGEAAAIPLYFTSILIGLCAALPICSTVFSPPPPGSVMPFSATQLFLLGITLFIRVSLWPAVALDWSTVRKWEQEVVRRPRGRSWAYLQAAHHAAREQITQRAESLGKQLAQSELKSSSSITSIPKQSLGLLVLYSATLLLSATGQIRLYSQLFVSAACILVFLQGVGRLSWLEKRPRNLAPFIIAVATVFLLATSRILYASSQHPPLPKIFIHDFSRLSLLSAVTFLVISDMERLLTSLPHTGIEVGSAPVDKRYSTLKKITQTAQWLAKPQHLVSLLMQTDVLLATLKITVSW